MKYRKYQALFVLTATLMLCTQPLQVLADEQTGNTDVNKDVTMQVPGQSGKQNSGNTTNNTNSSSDRTHSSSTGSTNNTYTPTAAETGAANEKNSVKNILKDYIDQIKNEDNYYTGGLSNGNGDLFDYGVSRIPDSSIANLLEHIQSFEGYLAQQDGLDRWTNIYDNVSNNEHPRKELDATDEAWNTLSDQEKQDIKMKIASQEGIADGKQQRGSISLAGTNNADSRFAFNGNHIPPFFISTDGGYGGYKGPYSGVRSDLIHGGFQDFNSWSGRYQGLSRLTSNAMEDFLAVGYIQDYHITNVKAHELKVVSWTSDERRWKVENIDTGEIMHPDGADADGYIITDNPEHALSIAFDHAGHYRVTAEQKAIYYEETSVSYDICEYLFDVETNNLLYFNEKTVSNGRGGSVSLGGEQREGWVETGDVFNWNVNDLGEIETDESATQRVE